jgi:hypothetical protein
MYIIGLICLALGMTACDSDFLDKVPQTSITADGFFKTADDLKTYTTNFYNSELFPPPLLNDFESDNVTIYTMSSDTWNMVRGTLNEATVAENTYNREKWQHLRNVNFMLTRLDGVTGTAEDINHYVGIARFCRAYFYIGMVNRYSDVPWLNKVLETNDPDVYKTADPRALVVDSIMADLEFAAANIKPAVGNRTGFNKYAALTLLSRFALYEGTFRKYHPELGLESSANTFLQRAATASEEIINSGQFEITGKGSVEAYTTDGYQLQKVWQAPGFRNLFSSLDLSANKEVILWRDNNRSFSVGGGYNRGLELDFSQTRDLMESFLMKDGSRFTEQPGYTTKTYQEVYIDRDPRMTETIAQPGFVSYEGPFYQRPNLGGYGQIKFYPRTTAYVGGGGTFYGAFVTYRYAEILLNYAEAKAELGTLTQDDLGRSINQLRERVTMPGLELAAANTNPDPILAAQYPNVTGANAGVVLEIRRERRVELAAEGLRLWDLHRWYAGSLYSKKHQGIYIPKLGAYDVSGDGVPDIAILERPGAEGPIAGVPNAATLIKEYLYESSGNPSQFRLSDGDHGYVMMSVDEQSGKSFVEPKYYYRPIPQTQLILNPDLQQQAFWK